MESNRAGIGDGRPVDLTVIDSLDRLREHVPAWRSLLSASTAACAYQSPDWVLNWFATAGRKDRPHIVLLHRAGELVGVAPFAISRYGVGAASFEAVTTAATEPGDYGDPLLSDDRRGECAALLVEHLVSLVSTPRRVVTVRRIDESAALNAALVARDDVELTEVTSWVAPVTRFADWEDPDGEIERIAASLKLPKHRRKMERDLGPVTASFRAPIDESLTRLAEFHRARFGPEEAPRLLQRPRSFALLASGLRALDSSGVARMCELDAGDAPVAYEVGHNVRTRWVGQAAGFDVEAGKYRPGFMLVYEILLAARREGADEYDHGQGARPYKLHWSTTERRIRSVVLSRKSVGASAQRALQRAVASRRARTLLTGLS